MSNDLQTNLAYFMVISYNSFLLCHVVDIFFEKLLGSDMTLLRACFILRLRMSKAR